MSVMSSTLLVDYLFITDVYELLCLGFPRSSGDLVHEGNYENLKTDEMEETGNPGT